MLEKPPIKTIRRRRGIERTTEAEVAGERVAGEEDTGRDELGGATWTDGNDESVMRALASPIGRYIHGPSISDSGRLAPAGRDAH